MITYIIYLLYTTCLPVCLRVYLPTYLSTYRRCLINLLPLINVDVH